MKITQGSFSDFLRWMFDGLHRHSKLIYVILSIVTLALTIPIAYEYVAGKDYGEWYLCVPEVVLYALFAVVIVCGVFYSLTRCENSSNTQNEDLFKGCTWVILLVPLFVIFISIKCINYLILHCRGCKSRSDSHWTIEDRIRQLNEWKKKSIITEEEYSKQLARILDKDG